MRCALEVDSGFVQRNRALVVLEAPIEDEAGRDPEMLVQAAAGQWLETDQAEEASFFAILAHGLEAQSGFSRGMPLEVFRFVDAHGLGRRCRAFGGSDWNG